MLGAGITYARATFLSVPLDKEGLKKGDIEITVLRLGKNQDKD